MERINPPQHVRLMDATVALLKSWVQLTETTAGRDKLYRTAQYFSRFLAYYLAQRGYRKSSIEKIVRLSVALSTARKLFRFGKPIDNLKLVLESCMKISDGRLKALAIGRSLSLGIWLVLDSIQWLSIHRILDLSQAQAFQVQRLAAYGWMCGLAFSICADLYKIRVFLEKQPPRLGHTKLDLVSWFCKTASYSNKQESGKLCRMLLQDTLDILLPLNILNLVTLNSGAIGLIGTVTSLMGLYNVWPAQMAPSQLHKE